MSFLDPTAMLVAAGLTIPPLIALYFLKLKRNVKLVASTLLWKKSVEDLQVNAPFQRLRSSLLLLLQLLILIAGAIALGKPMFQTAQRYEGTSILLIDQSASMGILEEGGQSRLDIAKEEAKRRIENLEDGARAMIVAFCDRPTVISSFDTDKEALKRKIDSIEQTQSRSRLAEAVQLAEAHTQNIMIGTSQAGNDITPVSAAPPASVFLFTDGRIEDAADVSIQRLDVTKIQMVTVGQRSDNVGIMAMDARRNYESPENLSVTATIRNFGPEPVTLDAVLYIEGELLDVQTLVLTAGPSVETQKETPDVLQPNPGSIGVIAFDEVEFEGGGLVEVRLRIDDALTADNRAWTIIQPPRHLRVLLVSDGNIFLEHALATLAIQVEKMTPKQYEDASDDVLLDGDRSAFDVVMFDNHNTDRLAQGNYFFWGSIPQIEGVRIGETVSDQVIFNWDETHPVLRHVAIETLFVYEWLDITLPPEAISIIEGERSDVLAYLTRGGSQYLIAAFTLIGHDAAGNALMNTFWPSTVDFVVFMQNAVNFLGSNIVTIGQRSVVPGEPVTMPVPAKVDTIAIERPDGSIEHVNVRGAQSIHYARTRMVGPFHLEPGVKGSDTFAVNLYNPTESWVAPSTWMSLGADSLESRAGSTEINEPAWPYVLMAMLVILLLEWVVYNQRVFV